MLRSRPSEPRYQAPVTRVSLPSRPRRSSRLMRAGVRPRRLMLRPRLIRVQTLRRQVQRRRRRTSRHFPTNWRLSWRRWCARSRAPVAGRRQRCTAIAKAGARLRTPTYVTKQPASRRSSCIRAMRRRMRRCLRRGAAIRAPSNCPTRPMPGRGSRRSQRLRQRPPRTRPWNSTPTRPAHRASGSQCRDRRSVPRSPRPRSASRHSIASSPSCDARSRSADSRRAGAGTCRCGGAGSEFRLRRRPVICSPQARLASATLHSA